MKCNNNYCLILHLNNNYYSSKCKISNGNTVPSINSKLTNDNQRFVSASEQQKVQTHIIRLHSVYSTVFFSSRSPNK